MPRAASIAIRFALLAAAGAGAWWWWQTRAADEARASAPKLQTARINRGDIVVRVSATGSLSPRLQVQVSSQVSGRVAEVLVDFNATVKRGETLARLDPRVFEDELRRASANLDAARAARRRAGAEATFAKAQLRRLQPLLERGAVAAVEVDRARQDGKLAEIAEVSADASVAIASAAVEAARTNVALTTIVAPIDGVVISRDVEVGQTVAASLQAPQLFLIAGDLRSMELHTSVAEADVGQLRAGMAVEFHVDAWPQRTFVGKVGAVRYAPTVVQNVVTYDAVVAVDNADLALRPGMSAEATFVVERRPQALRLPVAALRVKVPGLSPPGDAGHSARSPAAGAPATPAGGAAPRPRRRFVARLDSQGQPALAPIAVGVGDGEFVEVLDGLREGDAIVVGVEQRGGPGGPGGKAPRYGRLL